MKRETFLYEVMLRFGPEGLVGAHQIDLERVSDGEEIVAEKELPATAITSEQATALIGEQVATMAAQISALTAERDNLRTRLAG